MSKSIVVQADDVSLEAVLNENDSQSGVVVTHPHPLFGGDMDNPVVSTICTAFEKKGFTTLRFNFRGAGKSSGVHDNGRGEQDDVKAALNYLQTMGIRKLWLAGYSFGSRINASVVSDGFPVEKHIMVSPPVAFMPFDELTAMPVTPLVITGAEDEIAPPDQVKSYLKKWGIHPQFIVLEGCDHFFSGNLLDLEHRLIRFLKE